jgi:hypothetical protein
MVVAGGLLLLEALGALAVEALIWSPFFGAAGLGFAYVFSRRRENWWAAIPAGVLGVLVGLGAEGASNYVWPAALVAGGLYLILRAPGPGRKPRSHG